MRILKVNERNLVPSIDADKLTMSFDADDVDEVINRTGQPRLAGRDGDRRRAQPPGRDRDPAQGHPARKGARRLPRRRRSAADRQGRRR